MTREGICFSRGLMRKKYQTYHTNDIIIKWFLNSLKEDTRKISLSEKIFFELISILKTDNSKTVTKKKLTVNLAAQNRANLHYRW